MTPRGRSLMEKARGCAVTDAMFGWWMDTWVCLAKQKLDSVSEHVAKVEKGLGTHAAVCISFYEACCLVCAR